MVLNQYVVVRRNLGVELMCFGSLLLLTCGLKEERGLLDGEMMSWLDDGGDRGQDCRLLVTGSFSLAGTKGTWQADIIQRER